MRPLVQPAGCIGRDRDGAGRGVLGQAERKASRERRAGRRHQPGRAIEPREVGGQQRAADPRAGLVADDGGGQQLAPCNGVCSDRASSVGQITTPWCAMLAACMSSRTRPCPITALAKAASAGEDELRVPMIGRRCRRPARSQPPDGSRDDCPPRRRRTGSRAGRALPWRRPRARNSRDRAQARSAPSGARADLA